MANFSDYIKWRGDIPFSVSAFNKIDSLILSQLCYLNFGGLLKEMDFSEKINLHILAELFRNSPDYETRKDCGMLINALTPELLKDAGESLRFKEVLVTGYSEKYNPEKEEQFSAVTFVLPEKLNVVCFRGTDDTIIGWKEDFNLARYDSVPAQRDACEYLEIAMNKLKGSFVTAGHSKGGNLAIYSASNVSEKNQKRINTIYNFDGPGFSDSRLNSEAFLKMEGKIRSFYPYTCIVGSLYNHHGEREIVESSEKGLMQHDPYGWQLIGTEFVTKPDFDEVSKVIHESFNQWIINLSQSQCDLLVETLFEIVSATEANTNSELEDDIPRNLVKVIKKIRTIEPEVRQALNDIVSPLSSIIYSNLPTLGEVFESSSIGKKAVQTMDNVKNKIQDRVKKIESII